LNSLCETLLFVEKVSHRLFSFSAPEGNLQHVDRKPLSVLQVIRLICYCNFTLTQARNRNSSSKLQFRFQIFNYRVTFILCSEVAAV